MVDLAPSFKCFSAFLKGFTIHWDAQLGLVGLFHGLLINCALMFC